MRRGDFLDRDRERDHVRPETRSLECRRRRENQRDHVKWHTIPAIANALGCYERGDDADRWEDEQIRPLE